MRSGQLFFDTFILIEFGRNFDFFMHFLVFHGFRSDSGGRGGLVFNGFGGLLLLLGRLLLLHMGRLLLLLMGRLLLLLLGKLLLLLLGRLVLCISFFCSAALISLGIIYCNVS